MKKISEIKAEKLHYQFNTSSYYLVLLSLIFTLISLFSSINSDDFLVGNSTRIVPDGALGIEIGIGILIMLTTFLTAEKLKTYNKNYTYFTFFLSALNIVRIFFIPFTRFFAEKPAFTLSGFLFIVFELVISSILLLFAGIISWKKIKIIENFDKGVTNV
jgi:hypothetical protein